MNKIVFSRVGKQMFCEVVNPVTNNTLCFSTNNLGEGLWVSAFDEENNCFVLDRKQIQGTAQFTIRGLKPNSQKAKLRKFIKKYFDLYFREFWDCDI